MQWLRGWFLFALALVKCITANKRRSLTMKYMHCCFIWSKCRFIAATAWVYLDIDPVSKNDLLKMISLTCQDFHALGKKKTLNTLKTSCYRHILKVNFITNLQALNPGHNLSSFQHWGAAKPSFQTVSLCLSLFQMIWHHSWQLCIAEWLSSKIRWQTKTWKGSCFCSTTWI